MEKDAKRELIVISIILLVTLSCLSSTIDAGKTIAVDMRNTREAQELTSTALADISIIPPSPTSTTARQAVTQTNPKNLASATVAPRTSTQTRIPPTAVPRSPTPKSSATTAGSYTTRGQFQARPDMFCKDWTCQISHNSIEMTIRPNEGVVTGKGTIKLIGDRAGCPAVETTMSFDFTSMAYSANWFNGTVKVTSSRAFPEKRCSVVASVSFDFPWEAQQNDGKITGKLTGANNEPYPFTLTRVP
jgi:hypothetical protein